MSKTKQKSHAAKKVAVFFIVFIIIEMLLVGGAAYVFRNDDVTPSFGGYSVFIMDSDNMSDTIPKDALVVVENGTPGKDKIGKAVLCENVPEIGSTIMWLKDITSKGENVDGVVYTVYQEEGKDYDLKSSDIIGIAPSYYITAGKVLRFISTPIGIAACAAAPVALWILIEIIVLIASHSGKKHDDDEEYDEEYDSDDEQVSVDDILFGKDDATPLNFEKKKDNNQEMIDDISFASEKSNVDEQQDEQIEQKPEEVSDADEETAETQEEVVHHADVDETVSTTRKAASDSLEELMKMMEDEQQKLKEQLKK